MAIKAKKKAAKKADAAGPATGGGSAARGKKGGPGKATTATRTQSQDQESIGGDLLDEVTQRQNTQRKRSAGRPPLNDDEKIGGEPGPDADPDQIDVLDDPPVQDRPPVDPELVDLGTEAAVTAEIGVCSGLLGEQFSNKYYGVDDEKILKAGFRYYIQVNGLPNLPGWLVVLITQAAYFFQRIGSAKGQGEIMEKIRGMFTFGKKKSKQAAGPAPAGGAAPAAATQPAAPAASPPPAAPGPTTPPIVSGQDHTLKTPEEKGVFNV